jgi:hypothetical protein
MDYNLTLFKDSVRDILLMSVNNPSSSSNQDPNSSKNQTIDANLSQAMGASNMSFSNGESGDSGFILGGDMK